MSKEMNKVKSMTSGDINKLIKKIISTHLKNILWPSSDWTNSDRDQNTSMNKLYSFKSWKQGEAEI